MNIYLYIYTYAYMDNKYMYKHIHAFIYINICIYLCVKETCETSITFSRPSVASYGTYRGASLIRNRAPPTDPLGTHGIGLR